MFKIILICIQKILGKAPIFCKHVHGGEAGHNFADIYAKRNYLRAPVTSYVISAI